MTPASAQPQPSRFRSFLILLGLSGFAIADPLLTIFGSNPGLFAFHNADNLKYLAVYAVSLILIPPLLMWLIASVVAVIRPVLGRAIHHIFVAALIFLWSIQLCKWSLDIQAPAVMAGFAISLTILLLTLYLRSAFLRSSMVVLALLPVATLIMFIYGSEVAALWQDGEEHATGMRHRSGSQLPSVLFLILDEFPTLALFDENTNIDAKRFPNLAAFAEQATWYRHFSAQNATTVYSVPSMLTGLPPSSKTAIGSNYQHNLFKLLADSHHLTVFESSTNLCDFEMCSHSAPGYTVEKSAPELKNLYGKTLALWIERIALAAPKPQQLNDFRDEMVEVSPSQAPPPGTKSALGKKKKSADGATAWAFALHPDFQAAIAWLKPRRHQEFLATLIPSGDPALHYLHLDLPHIPWRFYHNGEMYDLPSKPSLLFAANEQGGEWIARLTEYRFLQQARYADALVGEIFRKAQENGMWDDMLVVLLSDHGRSFRPNTNSRWLEPKTIDWITYVPLLIKRPGQTKGHIDDSNVMGVDVLPTIADILNIRVQWAIQGLPIGHADMAARGDEKNYYPAKAKGLHQGVAKPRTFSDSKYFPAFSARWIRDSDPKNELVSLLGLLDLDQYFNQPVHSTKAAGGWAEVADLEKLLHPPEDKPPLGVVVGQVETETVTGSVLVSVNGVYVAGSPLIVLRGKPKSFVAMLPEGILQRHNELGIHLVLEDGPHPLKIR